MKELKMVERIMFYDTHPALKHGAYSGMTLLPGEDPKQFQELFEEVIAEYQIDGRSEHAIALKLAHVLWREQHLGIYAYAAQARKLYSEIRADLLPERGLSLLDFSNAEQFGQAEKAAKEKATKELGGAWKLVELGDVLTLNHLLKEMEVAERLSRLKERLLKQLMFVRGAKSMSMSSPTPAPPPRIGNAA
jgi:hypothetical protein